MGSQKTANLRVCASCEWVFREEEIKEDGIGGCPKCGFAHYGARYVYGNKAYRHQWDQEPWLERQKQKLWEEHVYPRLVDKPRKQKIKIEQFKDSGE